MRYIYAVAAPGVSTLISVDGASATDVINTYNISHTFTLAPSGGAPLPPTYDFGAFATALPGGTPDFGSGSGTFGPGGGTFSQQATSASPLSNATAVSSATLSPFTLG